MALPEEKKQEILSDRSKYPRATKLTEPLLVRPDKLSLLVNDTMFYAKIKTGLAAKGFLIYSSGLGIPIYEKVFSRTETTNLGMTFGVSDNLTEEAEKEKYIRAAKKWLDELEIEIADQVNDNPIKAAIDRLNWQSHFDTTGSSTDFVTEFAENDFAEVNIDWNHPDHGTDVNVNTIPITVNKAVEDIAGVNPSTPSDRGTLLGITRAVKDVDEQIQTLDSSLNDSTDGTLPAIKSSITTLDGNLNNGNNLEEGNFGTLCKISYKLYNDQAWKMSDKDSLYNRIDYIGTSLRRDTSEYTISECLRESGSNGDTFSVVKALRQTGEDSVSKAVDDARTTISGDISSQTTTLNTSLGSANSKLDTIDGRLHFAMTGGPDRSIAEWAGWTNGDVSSMKSDTDYLHNWVNSITGTTGGTNRINVTTQ